MDAVLIVILLVLFGSGAAYYYYANVYLKDGSNKKRSRSIVGGDDGDDSDDDSTDDENNEGDEGDDNNKKKQQQRVLDKNNSVSVEDMAYLLEQLEPTSTHMDVLVTSLSTPEMMEAAIRDIKEINRMRERRKKQKEKEDRAAANKAKQIDFDSLLDQGGWDDDDDKGGEGDGDDDDERTKKEREALRIIKEKDKEKEKEMERLKHATGQTVQLLEGIDDGVVGQEWVEKQLESKGAWPPPLLEGKKNEKNTLTSWDIEILKEKLQKRYGDKLEKKRNGKSKTKLAAAAEYYDLPTSEPLKNRAFRRNMCVLMGRLNSQYLNGHEILMDAVANNKTDSTYFKKNLEIRQRTGMILEACLRLSMMLRSYRLLSTVVEAVTMFKLGCSNANNESLPWFNGMMARQYDTLPRIKVLSKSVVSLEGGDDKDSGGGGGGGEDKKDGKQQQQQRPVSEMREDPNRPIGTGEKAAVILELLRSHAENFTKHKIATCQKQGIPPQVALSSYREGWWLLLRAEPLTNIKKGGDKYTNRDYYDPIDRSAAVFQSMKDDDLNKFDNESVPVRDVLMSGWPLIVQNVGQKSGKAKVMFTAPNVPGKYRLHVSIKSQDFLGADQDLYLDVTIVESDKKKKGEEDDDKQKKKKKGPEDEDEEEPETKKDK